MDDAMVALYQNGEAIRPEQGFPMRLLLPGFEGNMNVKWLRRLNVTDAPVDARDETSHYTELMPSGKARQFMFPHGREIRDPQTLLWNDHERAGIIRSLRPGMVGRGPDFESGSLRGWRQDMGGCCAERAGIVKGPDAFPLAVALGWEAFHADEPGDGRDGRHAAHAGELGRCNMRRARGTTSTVFRAGASRPMGR